MAPSTIKYLYAAFAENSSCGPSSYYEEAMQCGSSSNTTTTAGNKTGPTIVENRTFDGSLEVGIRKESGVFDHTTAQEQDVQLPSSPHKEDDSRGTPDTSPNSSPEPSVDLNNDNTAGDVYSGPQCPSLSSLEYEKSSNTGASHLAMKKTSFVDINTTLHSIGQDRSSEDISFTPTSKPRVVTAEVIKSEKKLEVGDIKPVQQQEATNRATTNMFTKEDLDAITPRQIKSYLTEKEQKKISTHVLSSNGYTLAADKNEVCNVCSMPKLYASGELVESCEICPVLKEHVLKKILDGATGTPITTSSSFVDVAGVNNAGLIDVADLSPFEQDLLVGALSSGSSTAMKNNVSVANDAGTSSKENTEISTANDNFIVETKKSVIDGVFNTKQLYDSLKSSFVCNFDELEVPAGKDSVEHAREVLGSKVDLLLAEMAKCNPDFEYHMEAVEVASEMMSSKVTEYTHSVQQSKVTRGLDFKEVQEATGHAAEVLTANVSCTMPNSSNTSDETSNVQEKDAESVDGKQTAELKMAGTKEELRASAENALIDQDDQDDEVKVEADCEDCEDARDESGLLDKPNGLACMR